MTASTGTSRGGAAWALALLIAAGAAARLTPWRNVFSDQGVELVPADSHYYVRFAQLQIASFPRFTQFDPWVNYPDGARIIWPPLHALFVAGVIRTGALVGVSPEAAAAWVDPLAALVWLTALSVLALRLRGAPFAVALVGVVALTPVSVWNSSLGNADHHVHELFLPALLLLAQLELSRTKSAGWAVAGGVAAGLARSLSTVGGILTPVVAVGPLVAAMISRDRRWPRLAALTGASLVTAETGVALALGNLALLDYELIGGFRVLFGLAVFTVVSALCGWLVDSRRWLWTLIPGAACLLAIEPELQRAVLHLAARDPLLAHVAESQPLLASPGQALSFIGPLGVLLPVAGLVALLARRSPHGRRTDLGSWGLVAASLLATTALALLQARFLQLWIGVAAVAVGLGLERLQALDGRCSSVRRFAAPALAAVWGFATVPLLAPEPTRAPQFSTLRGSLEWIRNNTERTDQRAVLSEYLYGHWINLWAGRPAVASTFSQTRWHVAGNERAYAILRAPDEETAFALCRQSGVGFVLGTRGASNLGAPDPREVPALLARLDEAFAESGLGRTLRVHRRFRLLHEAREGGAPSSARRPVRVYEAVEGATLEGLCAPGAAVVLEGVGGVDGRPLRLEGHASRCDRSGTFTVRVAQPGRYWLTALGWAFVSEQDVRSGATKRLSWESSELLWPE